MSRHQWSSLMTLMLLAPLAAIGLLGIMLKLRQLLARRRRDYYEDALSETVSWAPVCQECGYSLFYARDQKCPECGVPFDLSQIDGRLAAWDGQVLRPRETTHG